MLTNQGRLPDFLVIGAMKCGTTTLYYDLLALPSVFMPDKESDFLCKEISSDEYASHFQSGGSGTICGDVSPDYAKLPESADVVPRAKRLLPASTRIIFIIREPVARFISHHFHVHTSRGEDHMEMDINRAAREFPPLVNYSRYAMQLRPWIEAFGRDAVHVIKFEDYVADRIGTMVKVCEFLGIPPKADEIDTGAVYNRGDSKPVLTGFWRSITQSGLYRRVLRPLFPLKTRDKIRNWLLPGPPAKPDPPNLDTVEYLVNLFRVELEELQLMLGDSEPLWDMDAVLENFRSRQDAGAA